MPPANPLVTEMTQGNRSKTASMHQKQPPPKSAISVLFVLIELVVCAIAVRLITPKRQAKNPKNLFHNSFDAQDCGIYSRCLSRQSIFRFRFVQMFAGWQVGVFLKMLRPQRLGNRVFAVKPFAKVNQFAALRTERRKFSREPVAGFFAGWTFDLRRGLFLFGFRCNFFDVR